MNISSSVANSNVQLAALQQQSPVNSSERSGREHEKDGDRDDGSAAVKATGPSVNLNGQAVGTRISVTA